MSVASAISDYWNRATHPVYNALGRNVGYYGTLQELARGQIYVYPGEQLPPASEWRVKSLLGVLVPARDLLIDNGLQPVWLSRQDALAQHAKDKVINVPELKLPDLPDLDLTGLVPDLAPDLSFKRALDWQTLAVWGGAGLVAWLLIRRVMA